MAVCLVALMLAVMCTVNIESLSLKSFSYGPLRFNHVELLQNISRAGDNVDPLCPMLASMDILTYDSEAELKQQRTVSCQAGFYQSLRSQSGCSACEKGKFSLGEFGARCEPLLQCNRLSEVTVGTRLATGGVKRLSR